MKCTAFILSFNLISSLWAGSFKIGHKASLADKKKCLIILEFVKGKIMMEIAKWLAGCTELWRSLKTLNKSKDKFKTLSYHIKREIIKTCLCQAMTFVCCSSDGVSESIRCWVLNQVTSDLGLL